MRESRRDCPGGVGQSRRGGETRREKWEKGEDVTY
jgi:hypothetical protein